MRPIKYTYMENIFNEISGWMQSMGMSEELATFLMNAGVILLIAFVAYLINRICVRFVIPVIRKFTAKTDAQWDDYLLSDDVLKNLSRLVTPILVYILLPLAVLDAETLAFAFKICHIYITIVIMMLICSIISSFYAMTSENEKLKNHSLKSFYQMIKLIVICIGTIIIISTLIGQNPGVILTGLGAGTAILMLVFQDTIKGTGAEALPLSLSFPAGET